MFIYRRAHFDIYLVVQILERRESEQKRALDTWEFVYLPAN